MSDETKVKRDPVTGQFLPGTKISTKDATERGKLGYTVKKAEDKEQLIVEAGYTVDNCPTDFKLLCKRAAQGDVRAILEYGKMTRPSASQPDTVNNCEYFEGCILLSAYRNESSQEDTDASKQRLATSRSNGE